MDKSKTFSAIILLLSIIVLPLVMWLPTIVPVSMLADSSLVFLLAIIQYLVITILASLLVIILNQEGIRIYPHLAFFIFASPSVLLLFLVFIVPAPTVGLYCQTPNANPTICSIYNQWASNVTSIPPGLPPLSDQQWRIVQSNTYVKNWQMLLQDNFIESMISAGVVALIGYLTDESRKEE